MSEQATHSDPWRDDALGRRGFADAVSRVIRGSERPIVINISAPYGSGKTFFLTRLRRHLHNQGQVCVFIDAWSSDFHTEPLLVLFSEFTEQLAAAGLIASEGRLVRSARVVGRHLISRALPGAVRLATAGLLDVSQLGKEISEAHTKELADVLGGVSADVFAEYQEKRKSVAEFKDALSEAAVLGRGEGRKLVVVVDELDRCRPPYAIQLLETIKHLFDVPGVAFILGADAEALENAVGHVFGRAADRTGYLGRLVDWRLNLPRNIDQPEQYARHLAQEHELADSDWNPGWMAAASRAWDLTLREQSNCVRRLKLLFTIKPELAQKFPDAVTVLLSFETGDPKGYRAFISTNEELEALVQQFAPRLGIGARTRLQEFRAGYSPIDQPVFDNISMFSQLLAIQMFDDTRLRSAVEAAQNDHRVLGQLQVSFGNYGRQLLSRACELHATFELDALVSETHTLREYLSQEIALTD